MCNLFSFSYGELHFAPGDSELEIAVNVINDDIPEVGEYFYVSLKNPKGGAEIGFGGQMTVIVPTNDDAHGVVGFSPVSKAQHFAIHFLTCFKNRLTNIFQLPWCRTLHHWRWKNCCKIIKLFFLWRGEEALLAD